MNIVIVSDAGEPDGASTKIAILSARALAERGHDILYVHAVGAASRLLDHPNIRVHAMGLRDVWQEANPLRAAATGVWNGRAAGWLAALLATVPRRTVVHLHHYTRALSPAVLKVAGQSGLPWAFTLHDYVIACPNGLYYDHRAARPCTVHPLSARCAATACDGQGAAHKLVRLARLAATRRALAARRRPLTLICPSAFARDVARPLLPDDTRAVVVPNPVDIEQAPPAPVAHNRRILFMGLLAREKGVGVLAAAARQAGAELAFVGAGPYEAELRRINPDAAILPWPATRAEVLAHMDTARAIAFPSLWYEPFGLSAMEALARGIPLVTTATTALSGAIDDGVDGFLTRAGDVDSLAAALTALRDDAVAERVGLAAWTRYWQNPSTPARHAERLLGVYRTMLAAVDAGVETVTDTDIDPETEVPAV
ncbi:glycosyltransferase family 4 protein [Azospirillum halopraeferens]|uniref:glycosyltransferase family 4 protein n=1 Tax=Azospirillum halopraeferens TaxID=34010 RepID=UPI0004014C7C|nr:glycosyltransferase family 4 protein [Azospirillum halopraeferens]